MFGKNNRRKEMSKLSKDIETNFTKFIFCDIHKDQRIESFCKCCEKAVCEECIVESHTCTECQSNICTIYHEFEETRQKLQGDIDRIETNKADNNALNQWKNEHQSLKI